MPKKHGISHSLATLTTSILSAVISKAVVDRLSFCKVLWDKLGLGMSSLFYKLTRIYIMPDIFPIALLAALFAFGWGAAFALMHKD